MTRTHDLAALTALALTASLFVGCRAYPETELHDVAIADEREGVALWRGDVYSVQYGSVHRWDGTDAFVERPVLPNGATRFHTEGDALWLALREPEAGWAGPERLYERASDGTWSEVDMPGWRVGAAITGPDAWAIQVEDLGGERERRTLHRRIAGSWSEVPVDAPGGAEPRQLVVASSSVYVGVGTGFDGTSAVGRWDGDGFTWLAAGPYYGLRAVNDHVYVTRDNRLEPVEETSPRIPDPPPPPERDPTNHGVHYLPGAAGGLLCVQTWVEFGGGFGSLGGGVDRELAAIDRLVDDTWEPVAHLDFSPARIIELDDGDLLVWEFGWKRVSPRP